MTCSDLSALPLDDKLVLFVSRSVPNEAWQGIAKRHCWEMIACDEMLPALGVFVMLMPDIVILDGCDALGIEVGAHIQDVIDTAPQRLVIIIELGRVANVTRAGNVLRMQVMAHASPAEIMSLLSKLLSSDWVQHGL
ncbi:MAG: hypothetical protein SNJ83_12520 [Aggregatilineales bacterium]